MTFLNLQFLPNFPYLLKIKRYKRALLANKNKKTYRER